METMGAFGGVEIHWFQVRLTQHKDLRLILTLCTSRHIIRWWSSDSLFSEQSCCLLYVLRCK